MRTRTARWIVASLVALVLLAACGSEPSITPGSGAKDPDTPVTSGPGTTEPPAKAGPTRVRPKPGMEDVRPVGWEKVKKAKSGRSLDVIYWSGVEPCYVLDRVDVEYGTKTVIVTLYEGHNPADKDTACIDIALQKVVKVKLDEPLDGRRIVDGAR